LHIVVGNDIAHKNFSMIVIAVSTTLAIAMT